MHFCIYIHKERKPNSLKHTTMSILDWDNDILDVQGTRIALNTDLQNKETPIGKALAYSDSSKVLIDPATGILQFGNPAGYHGPAEFRGHHDAFSAILADGTITGVQCSILNITEMKYVSPSDVPTHICCTDALITECSGMKDLTFNIYSNYNYGNDNTQQAIHNSYRHDMRFQWRQECRDWPTKWRQVRHAMRFLLYSNHNKNFFENVTVNYNNCKENLLWINIDDFGLIDFGGLNSNVEVIQMYTPTVFPEEFMDLFETGWSCKIYDVQKRAEVDMPVKNIKKAVAIANNPKRYRLLNRILKVKEGASLDKILHIKHLTDLQCFSIENNNVTLMFAKEGSQFAKPWSFSRTNGNRNSNSIDDMYDKTADGWYVIFLCNK